MQQFCSIKSEGDSVDLLFSYRKMISCVDKLIKSIDHLNSSSLYLQMAFCKCVQLIARSSLNFCLAISEIFHVIRGGSWTCKPMWRSTGKKAHPSGARIAKCSSFLKELGLIFLQDHRKFIKHFWSERQKGSACKNRYDQNKAVAKVKGESHAG